METLDVFLQAPQLLWLNHVKKMIRTEFVDLKACYNLYFFYLSVGHIKMIASPSEKEVHSFHEVQRWGL
jgi:hypothetical protein